MAKCIELSVCEMTTMKCIWDTGAITAIGIVEMLDKVYGLKYDKLTILKFLEKLLQIGFIDSRGKSEKYYFPVKEEKDFKQEQQRKVLKFWARGAVNHFASGL